VLNCGALQSAGYKSYLSYKRTYSLLGVHLYICFTYPTRTVSQKKKNNPARAILYSAILHDQRDAVAVNLFVAHRHTMSTFLVSRILTSSPAQFAA
jgi:hypothetical protein